MEISNYFSDLVTKFNIDLKRFIDNVYSDVPHSSLIKDSMAYSLNCGGKRLRPLILLEFSKLFGASYEKAFPFAAAVEMIHTYSLIHDDLPAMDNDDLRRGNPTCHVVYGEDVAILAGDGLLNLAHETMLSAAIEANYNADFIKAAYEISKSSGISGMILGQVIDIKNESNSIDRETLDYINSKKTGQLIVSSGIAGAIIGGASQDSLERVRLCLENVGIAFQLIDDVLDVEGNENLLGKPIGSDAKNSKTTYPDLLGLEETKKLAYKLYEEGISTIKELNIPCKELEYLLHKLVSRSN